MRHHPGTVLVQVRTEVTQHRHPGLDVTALRPADLPLGDGREVGQVAILDRDEVGLAEREVQMELDETGQRVGGTAGALHHGLATVEQSGADPDQQLDEQCLLVGEVPVDGRAADARRGADVLEADGQEPALGDQLFGCGQQL